MLPPGLDKHAIFRVIFSDAYCQGHVSPNERASGRQIVQNQVKDASTRCPLFLYEEQEPTQNPFDGAEIIVMWLHGAELRREFVSIYLKEKKRWVGVLLLSFSEASQMEMGAEWEIAHGGIRFASKQNHSRVEQMGVTTSGSFT